MSLSLQLLRDFCGLGIDFGRINNSVVGPKLRDATRKIPGSSTPISLRILVPDQQGIEAATSITALDAVFSVHRFVARRLLCGWADLPAADLTKRGVAAMEQPTKAIDPISVPVAALPIAPTPVSGRGNNRTTAPRANIPRQKYIRSSFRREARGLAG
jgi:hypothetical protein